MLDDAHAESPFRRKQPTTYSCEHQAPHSTYSQPQQMPSTALARHHMVGPERSRFERAFTQRLSMEHAVDISTDDRSQQSALYVAFLHEMSRAQFCAHQLKEHHQERESKEGTQSQFDSGCCEIRTAAQHEGKRALRWGARFFLGCVTSPKNSSTASGQTDLWRRLKLDRPIQESTHATGAMVGDQQCPLTRHIDACQLRDNHRVHNGGITASGFPIKSTYS